MTSVHPVFGTLLPLGWELSSVDEIKSPEKSSCVAGPFGSNISSKYFVSDGVPVIRGSNLTDDLTKFVADGFVFVSPERALSYPAQHVRGGDLVFTCWGTIGQVGLIPYDGQYGEYIISNKQLKLRPDISRTDPHFLYYYFASRQMVQHIRNRAIGSAVPGINLGILKSLPVALPPLRIQHKIASILSAYDDLIENNNRRIMILEEMAQRIYREWFVDFRYPGHEGVPLMPSELGPIPERWEAVRLSDVATQSRTTVDPTRFPNERFEHFSIPSFDLDRRPRVEEGSTIRSNKFLVGQHAVLYSKLNPRIPRVWMANPNGENRSIASTELLVFTTGSGWSLPLLYCLLTSEAFADRITGMSGGTSTSHQRVRPADVLQVVVVNPSAQLRKQFDEAVGHMLRLSDSLRRASWLLRAVRDLLLPRLISGEVDVSDLDIVLPDAAA